MNTEFARSLGTLLADGGKSRVDAATALSGSVRVVCFYFSAHWCPPCRAFTPKLADFYKKVNASGKQLEIVFMSCDRDEGQFNSYFAEQPWLAVQYSSSAREDLAEKYGVKGIPALFVMNADGTVARNEGRDDVAGKGPSAFEDWAKIVKGPSYIAFGGKGVSLTTASAVVGKVNAEGTDKPPVDPSRPITDVQLRLHNGTTVRLSLNIDATVAVIFDYVKRAAPVTGAFELISGFPPRPLVDLSQTLEAADLLDSTIIQRVR
eukprot:TRINITY_DN2022_c0_g1_i11.p1 TRINITY_DN2022_c0_g1~~TRINITY_DN2022_c0_g1_i11.p1  ORF type:complete len:263 (-),score=54.79 TRINITY_DN2022_c0_g1_i11:24-812(-)